jgi:hypothetical protein
MSRSQSRARSDDADPASGAEEEPPIEDPSSNVPDTNKTTYENRRFVLPFQKSYYMVPPECVMWDGKMPVQVASGSAAYSLHESKSFPAWKLAEIVPKHMVQLSVKEGEGFQVGWYITFKIGNSESDDIYTLRPVHKTIASKFFAEWGTDGLSEKKQLKYKTLLTIAPSLSAQINPLSQRWQVVDAPANMLYTRPKKESKVARRAVDEEEDAASSATAKKGTLALAPQHSRRDEERLEVPSFGTGAQIFMQTPGMVTVSEGYLRFLIENQQR